MDCGLASTVSDVFTDSGVYPRKFKRLGIPQIYAGFGSGEEQRLVFVTVLHQQLESLTRLLFAGDQLAELPRRLIETQI
jgi:transketolase